MVDVVFLMNSDVKPLNCQFLERENTKKYLISKITTSMPL